MGFENSRILGFAIDRAVLCASAPLREHALKFAARQF
jgi:hypothetical protein